MRVEPELSRNLKFRRLKTIIGDRAMEFVVMLWAHCQENQRGEFWQGADADYVEMLVDWDGERGLLFRALVECGRPGKVGFIVPEPDGLRVHEWEEMNSQMVSNWRRNLNGRGGKTGSQREPNRKPVDNPTRTQRFSSDSAETAQTATEETGTSANPATKTAGSTDGSPGSQREPNGNPMVTPTGIPTGSQRTVVRSIIHSNQGESDPHTSDYELAQGRITLLNQLTGAKFNPPLHELDGIVGRLLEVNRDVAGMDRMLRRQVALWKDDPRMRNNLKPSTLFGDKFHDYFGQREQTAAPPGQFKKNGAAQNDRAEVLQTLTATRRQLAQLPPDSEERPALESEIETLEAQLA